VTFSFGFNFEMIYTLTMSNELAKYINSRRRFRDENAVKKQVKIAKQHGLTNKDKAVKEPHRLAKHHAMDCGQPGCILCGNPRKIFKERTAQEKRMYQDVEKTTDKHSNGTKPEDV
jgi:hypothetical protein